MSRSFQSTSKRPREFSIRLNFSAGYPSRNRGRRFVGSRAQTTTVATMGSTRPPGESVLNVVDVISKVFIYIEMMVNTSLALSDDGSILAELKAKPMFLEEICKAQKDDSELQTKRAQCESGVESDFQIGSNGCLMFKNLICIPKYDELIRKILQEAHSSSFSIHLGSTKMYNDLKKMYLWTGMKRDISEFVSRYLICQQVKVKHQVP
ncbi:uncharacterized protein LOC128042885 [Gossypium raimondii]|uniref:uncharacterized protein LOC128042885 n=1 Tax=Gossypium raimondii TaxID=29730 RepID=UPI00227BE785|nr:uncharacterized protein LOC128042885 [Gossypium raimondii]